MEMLNNIMNGGRAVQIDAKMVAEIEEIIQGYSLDGLPDMVEAGELSKYSLTAMQIAMQKLGLYVWPTYELAQELEKHCGDIQSTIEICSGNGVMAQEMGVPATDSFMQSDKFQPANEVEAKTHLEVMQSYELARIPKVVYGQNVHQMEASEAVVRLRPKTVFGLYVTHKWKPGLQNGNILGVDEEFILDRVERYIVAGNLKVHSSKPIMAMKHRAIEVPGLICRAQMPELNRLFIWEGRL